MPLTTIGKSILALAILGGGAAALTALKSNSSSAKAQGSQEEKVEYIADAMRDLQSLPGSASGAEIDNWENQMKKMVNPGHQKKVLCRLQATQAVTVAMVERSARVAGDQEMVASIQDDIRAIPPGSLEDWLFQMARGGIRPVEYVNNECMQQPTVHVLNPGIRRYSQEMRDLEEQCVAAGTC